MRKRDTSTQKMGHSAKNQASAFKPLIASSLALALGVSVASATCTPSNSPIFCNNDGEVGFDLNNANIQWSTINNYYEIQANNGNNNSANNILLWVGGTDRRVQFKNEKYEFQGLGGLTLKSNRGISVAGGSGNLGISLWTGASVSSEDNFKTFVLDLSSISSTEYAIKGNFYIEGNGGSDATTRYNVFNGNFGGRGISGNITLGSVGNVNLELGDSAVIGGFLSLKNGTNSIVFSGDLGDTARSGVIWVNGGTTTIKGEGTLTLGNIYRTGEITNGTIIFSKRDNATSFKIKTDITRNGELGGSNVGDLIVYLNDGTTMEGNIRTGTPSTGNDFSSNQVTFAGAISVNTIVFNGSIKSNGSGAGYAPVDTSNGNHITFSNGSANVSLEAISDAYNRIGYNSLTFTQEGATLSGSITGTGGRNDIVFENFGTISSNILASGSATGMSGNNNITFRQGGTISGTIKATAGTSGNDIVFEAGEALVSGTIDVYSNQSSQGGHNNITFANAVTQAIISGAISSGGALHGYTSTNTIVFNSAISKIAGNITSTTSIVGGSGLNSIAFTSGTSSLISGNISVNSGENQITFNNTAGTASITGSISNSNGTNNITFGTSGNLASSEITGNISTAGGSNIITFNANSGLVSITSNINATGGSNSITFSSSTGNTLGSATSTIIANGGTNNFIATTALTFNSSIYAGGSGTSGNGGDSGAGGANKFLLSGNVDFGNNLIIRAGNRNNQNTEKKNIIKFNSTLTGDKTILEVTAVTGNSYLERTANIFSFDGLNDVTNLTIGDINRSDVVGGNATGYNYIGKELISSVNVGNLALQSDFAGSWASNAYQATNLNLSIANNIYAKYGKNYINIGGLSVSGAIDGNAGTNNIATNTLVAKTIKARWGGVNNIVITAVSSQTPSSRIASSSTFSGLIMAGGDGNGSGNNYIYLDDTSTASFVETSSVSAYSGINYISFGNSATANNIAITSISANNNGKNYLAKHILSNNNGTLATQNINGQNWWINDNFAFQGFLTISEGISSSGGGVNYISFKANQGLNQTTSVIKNLSTSENGETILDTAVSGINNIYLNVADSSLGSGVDAIQGYFAAITSRAGTIQDAQQKLLDSSVIAGNIVNSGTTNIKIVGTANTTTRTATDKAQIGILGNISNTSGTLNIVLEDTFFAPSELIVSSADVTPPAQQPATYTNVKLGKEYAGNISTASGATTNIITRFTNPVVKTTGISMYNIDANQDSTTNVVIQGNVDLGTHIDYTKGSAVNLIFANANNMSSVSSDNFEAQDSSLNRNADSTLLGVTYQDGVKLAIADKTVMIGDNPSASFLETYSSYYTDGSKPLATVWANRTTDKDTVGIEGLVVGDIYSLASSGVVGTQKTYDVTLESGSAFAGKIKLDPSSTSAINIVMKENSKLILSDSRDGTATDTFLISSLKIEKGEVDPYQLQIETLKQTNNVINLASGGASANNVASRENFRLLVIGNADLSNGASTPATNTGLYGDGKTVFMTYVNTNASQQNATLGHIASSGKVNARAATAGVATDGTYGYAYSDRIIIANIGDNTKAQEGDYYMQFALDAHSKLGGVTYNASNDKNTSGGGGTKTAGNIAVLTVVNTTDTNSAGINLKTQDVLQGFDRIGGDLIAVETDITGEAGTDKTGYTTYFINNILTRGATEATQEVTASAFATNYDLYLANFNSLNKRMGELRDNDNSQGVWARVFSGAQSNDFSKSKSTYTTFQGGYDYALGMEGANNYIGLALAYSMSSSKSDLNAIDINGSTKGIEDIKSSAVEVAVYNSYVQDEGWYNDTIAKFSYIMSDFTMIGQTSNYSTNNMAFTLSDEFGYRFKLGEEREWYIDPQLEVAFGYFNQSDFVQTLGLSSLEGIAESIYTTRARLGSSFGYDFKKFTENKPIKASVYAGVFYEYDYVMGGDVTLTTNLGGETVSSSAISSDGRVVVNVGTNMSIKDNTRIYFDFESSFAGKITTDYQVNVGVRYSFGENAGYTPIDPNKKSITPLKINDEQTKEPKEAVENTQEATSPEAKSEQSPNSAENTTESKAQ